MKPALIGLAVALTGASPATGVTSDDLRAQIAKERKVAQAQKKRLVVKLRTATDRTRQLRRTLSHEPSVQEALTIASVVYGVSRSDLSSTAYCESTHRPYARNGQYLGLMQLGDGFRANSRYFRAGLDPFSPYANVLAAAEVIAVQGYRQWECKP